MGRNQLPTLSSFGAVSAATDGRLAVESVWGTTYGDCEDHRSQREHGRGLFSVVRAGWAGETEGDPLLSAGERTEGTYRVVGGIFSGTSAGEHCPGTTRGRGDHWGETERDAGAGVSKKNSISVGGR